MKTILLITFILIIFIIFVLYNRYLGPEKYTIGPAKIIEVGQCGGGVGFFGGNRTCPIKVKWPNGRIEVGKTYDYVMIGQKMYKDCWKEDDGNYCFLPFRAK